MMIDMGANNSLRSRDPTVKREDRMARKKIDRPGGAIGPVLAHNFYRLGYGDVVIRHAEISKLVKKKTGKKMSRQRIAAILNAVRVSDETIETLAKAVGVKVDELTKPPDISENGKG
jgi:hypothetical protein